MKAVIRWVLRAVRSPRCREQAARAVTALLLIAPVLLLALDHHGAERIPTHVHAVPAGQTVPAHLHGFEVPHVDRVGQPAPTPDGPAVAAPEPAAVLVLSFVQGLGMPLARPLALVAPAAARSVRPTDPLVDQTAFEPPTRPPTAPS